jgi:glycosyltransferase involved in cell wall biosynthesis
MRILAVTNLFPTPFQPQRATFNREQFRALAAEHEIQVLTPISWTEELSARRAGASALPRGRAAAVDGIPVKYPRSYSVPRVFRFLNGRFYRWSIRAEFRRAVRDFRPDVVYATWAYPDGWATVRLGHEANLPVVLKVHGSDVLLLDQYPSRRNGTTDALRRADRVVAVSRDLAAKVAKLGAAADRVHLVYNGVDADRFRPGDRLEARRRLGLDAERPMLLYVGNLLPVKGPDVLIKAAAILAARGVEFDLHVVGKGPMRPALEASVSEYGIGERVRFHGNISHDRLPDWFRAADMLVLPSRSEGVPNVLLEAMACGTPFVASDVGGVAEVTHLGSGDLVAAGDAGLLAEKIGKRLAVPPLATAGVVGRSHRTAALELTAVFEAALGRNRRPSLASDLTMSHC